MKKIYLLFTALLAIAIYTNAVAYERRLYDETVSMVDTTGQTTKIEQNGQDFQITMETDDGTSFVQLLNLSGDIVASISSLAIFQSELTTPFTIIDPIKLTNELYLNTAESVYFRTLDGDNLFEVFKNAGKHYIDWQADNDGTSGEEITNSDDTTVFGRYSDGYAFQRTSVASMTQQASHLMDYAGQGTAIGGFTKLIETYTDRAAVFRIDGVMDGGVLFDIRNAGNDLRRPDKPAGFFGNSDYIYAGDEYGVFYKWLFSGEELWLRNSTWKMSHNGVGVDPAFQRRTYSALNISDMRDWIYNGYIDLINFDNDGNGGLEYVTSSTATGGLKYTVTNGEYNLNAYKDVNLSSTTGNVHVADTFYVDKDNAGISLTDLDSAHYVFENTSGGGQSKLVFSFNGVAKGGVRGDVLGNFNWHGIGPQGHQFYNSIDNSSPAAGISDDGISIGGAAGQVSGDARLKIIGSSDLSDKYLIRSQNSSLADKFLVRNDGLVTVADTIEASVIKATNAFFKSSTIIATATYDILATDNFVGFDYTTSGAVTSELPSLAVAWDATKGVGQEITVKDTGGSAGTNIITINRKTATSDTIDGGTFATINVNDGSLTFRAISSTKWAIL